jgi:hypothetical protein
MKRDDQVECHLPRRLHQEPAVEGIALVQRDHRIDKARAADGKAWVGENVFGGEDCAGFGR